MYEKYNVHATIVNIVTGKVRAVDWHTETESTSLARSIMALKLKSNEVLAGLTVDRINVLF